MIVYRIARKKYAHDLSGIGAKIAGGRWNSPGNPVVYTSGSISLAMLEVAVHLPLEKLPKGFFLITIEVPEDIQVAKVDRSKLPLNWALSIQAPVTQQIGDLFLSKGKNLVLQVPSAVVPEEFNYLVNPNHKSFSAVKIISMKDLNFDSRLFKG
jgi:RES domain-containing protein